MLILSEENFIASSVVKEKTCKPHSTDLFDYLLNSLPWVPLISLIIWWSELCSDLWIAPTITFDA